MIDTLKEIALVIGYLSTIAGFGFGAFKVYKKIDKKLSTIEEHALENFRDIKRITLMSKDMPIGERLDAGEKYVNAGGNGEAKVHYYVLKKEREEELMHECHHVCDSHCNVSDSHKA